MNTMNKNTTRFITTFALVAACAARAHAADVAQMQVKYDDLNLSNTAGATVLYHRIRGAAIEVCGDAGNRELVRSVQVRTCIDHAIAQAVATVNAPLLTSVLQKKTGAVAVARFAAN